jgi:hypothetical protein
MKSSLRRRAAAEGLTGSPRADEPAPAFPATQKDKVGEPISPGGVSLTTIRELNPGRNTSVASCRDNLKESDMNRLLIGTAVAVLLGFSPVLAADDSNTLPTQPSVSHETSKSAHQPPSGSADTSGGAAEQSSAPPASGAASANKVDENAMDPDTGSADQSAGAKEQSSAPPGSSASDISKPNPSLGGESSKE